VLFYLQMRWNIERRATLDDVFTLSNSFGNGPHGL
jgi:hypothetical protein